MHVGMAIFFQNPGNRLSDRRVCRHEIVRDNISLFAEQVVPRLRNLDPGCAIGGATASSYP